MTDDSNALFHRACRVIPGGVNSPVRAFGAVGGEPVYMASGKGSRMISVEGRALLDFCGSWGPLILGHARQEVVAAIQEAAARGSSFGANTPAEVDLAEMITVRVPGLDMVRLVNSGTEAVMTALRLARGVTGRHKIVKFDGCYHGHSDCLLVSAGSGLLTGGRASSAGVPPGMTDDVLVAPYNDAEAIREIGARSGAELAAIIIEPVAGNMGLIPPKPGFLEALRETATAVGALLIFDEVITGFRLGPSSYGKLCGVTPDLTCLGKIIGGGMPIGAIGGRRAFMEYLAPLGDVYQAGTLSGNPVAVAAGLAMLRILKDLDYDVLAKRARNLAVGLNSAAREQGLAFHCAQLGGMFTPFFRDSAPSNLAEVRQCDTRAHAHFFRAMLARDIYLPPSQFEVCFVSAAHSDDDIRVMLEAARAVFSEM